MTVLNPTLCEDQGCRVQETFGDLEQQGQADPAIQPRLEWVEPVGWVMWNVDMRVSMKDHKRSLSRRPPYHMGVR